jgi:diaminopimelate decarboxylase
MGCNFDCASRNEIRLVMEATKDSPHTPEIIYANPCKSRLGLLEAVCKGVRMVTFDNEAEVQKCASISKSIQLILRMITDDRGSQCRLSSKFGAPRTKWRSLLAEAQKYGLQVIGVSFHVGSGCRDASRYEAALMDAREVFDLGLEYGMKMHLLDIGGGFPGETHSMWNPADLDPEPDPDDSKIGIVVDSDNEDNGGDHFMYFTEIAEVVAPMIDRLFDPSIRVIAEPGRYFVAACATLCCSVIATRTNQLDDSTNPEPINDKEASVCIGNLSRLEEVAIVRQRGLSMTEAEADKVLNSIHEELIDFTKLYAQQQLAQQEVDVYNDALDLYHEGFKSFETAGNLLGPPDESQLSQRVHTVEGMTYSMAHIDEEAEPSGLITLAAAGEAAINGVVLQAVADSAPLQDDFAYYINDGVYGGFNSIMFDHATVRPRILEEAEKIVATENDEGFLVLETSEKTSDHAPRALYASTVFGPTCDSIDVIARSVLLPKLKVGDFLYFQNMGAYTMAAASAFNGFTPSEKFYVCSVPPDYFDALIKGPKETDSESDSDEKKELS